MRVKKWKGVVYTSPRGIAQYRKEPEKNRTMFKYCTGEHRYNLNQILHDLISLSKIFFITGCLREILIVFQNLCS